VYFCSSTLYTLVYAQTRSLAIDKYRNLWNISRATKNVEWYLFVSNIIDLRINNGRRTDNNSINNTSKFGILFIKYFWLFFPCFVWFYNNIIRIKIQDLYLRVRWTDIHHSVIILIWNIVLIISQYKLSTNPSLFHA